MGTLGQTHPVRRPSRGHNPVHPPDSSPANFYYIRRRGPAFMIPIKRGQCIALTWSSALWAFVRAAWRNPISSGHILPFRAHVIPLFKSSAGFIGFSRVTWKIVMYRRDFSRLLREYHNVYVWGSPFLCGFHSVLAYGDKFDTPLISWVRTNAIFPSDFVDETPDFY